MKEKVMLTGVRPSGNITLGNYLGAIKNFVDRQDTYKSYIFIADLHAITSPQNPQKLKEGVYNCVTLKKCGQTYLTDVKNQKKTLGILVLRSIFLATVSFIFGIILKAIFKSW